MGGAILFLIIAFFLTLALLYGLAKALSGHYEINQREYKTILDNMPKIVGRVHREADRWPIYSRPVLFTKIDHKAQVEFSQVHRAMDEVDSLVPQLNNIKLPTYPEKIPPIFALPENVNTIVESVMFIQLVESFAYRILEILNLTKVVDGYLKEEIAEKQKVAESMKKLHDEVQEAQNKLASEEWAGTNLDHISWTLLTAQRCHDTAEERIKLRSGDGLEYAIAHIYTGIGNASLAYYRVYAEGLEETSRYVLDIFADFLKRSHRFLETILENENFSKMVTNELLNWRKLRYAQEQLDQFPEHLQSAKDSLEHFRQERQKFEALEGAIEPLEMDFEIADAEQVEAECERYWFSYQEKPGVWKQVIGENRPPAETMKQLKSELISTLAPSIKSASIKQSTLQKMSSQIEAFLERLEAGRQDIQKLGRKLNQEKAAEQQVQQLMDRASGTAGTAVGKLETITKDTSPDIQQNAIQLMQLYKIYLERATLVRGADFPDLLIRVQEFVDTANIWILKHEELLVSLEQKDVQYSREIKNALTDISSMLIMTPRVDDDIANQFTRLERAGTQLLEHFDSKGGYQSLNRYATLAETWKKESTRYLDPTRDLVKMFNASRDAVISQLRKTRDKIDQEKHKLQFRWDWVTSAMLPEIERAESKLDTELDKWNRHDGRNWIEMYLRTAIDYCEDMISRCNDIYDEFDDAITMINKDQKKFQEKENAIRHMANGNFNRISQEDISVVLLLCDVAKMAETYSMVDITLKRAEQIVTNAATPQEKQEARTIINNINTGGGTYIGGSVNTGGGDFTSRDSIQ